MAIPATYDEIMKTFPADVLFIERKFAASVIQHDSTLCSWYMNASDSVRAKILTLLFVAATKHNERVALLLKGVPYEQQ